MILPRSYKYAARYGADPRIWHFLTGPDTTLKALLQTGFKVGTVVKAETEDNLTHSSYFLLIDQNGKTQGVLKTPPRMERGQDVCRSAAVVILGLETVRLLVERVTKPG